MQSAAAILCDAILRRGIARISPDVMDAILRDTGLTLTGGAKQEVAAHLAEVERLSRETAA